jgi:hypothetical protein
MQLDAVDYSKATADNGVVGDPRGHCLNIAGHRAIRGEVSRDVNPTDLATRRGHCQP